MRKTRLLYFAIFVSKEKCPPNDINVFYVRNLRGYLLDLCLISGIPEYLIIICYSKSTPKILVLPTSTRVLGPVLAPVPWVKHNHVPDAPDAPDPKTRAGISTPEYSSTLVHEYPIDADFCYMISRLRHLCIINPPHASLLYEISLNLKHPYVISAKISP